MTTQTYEQRAEARRLRRQAARAREQRRERLLEAVLLPAALLAMWASMRLLGIVALHLGVI